MPEVLELFIQNRDKILTAAENEAFMRVVAHQAPKDIIAAENTRDGLRALTEAIDSAHLLIATHNDPDAIIAAELKREELLNQHAASIKALAALVNNIPVPKLRRV